MGEPFAFRAPGWRHFGLLALVAAACLTLFAMFASFDRVAYVRGIVVPASGMARLVAPQSGTVSALLTAQGQRVRLGQPLLTVASTAALPGGKTAPAQALEAYQAQQRLSGQAMLSDRQRTLAERGRQADQVRRLEADETSLAQQIAIQRERVAKNDDWLRRLQPLLAKGYVSNFAYRQQEEAGLSMRQQLEALAQRRAETQHDRSQAQLELLAMSAQTKGSLLREQAQSLALTRGAAMAQTQAESLIVAPFDGVLALLDVEQGETVTAGRQVAALMRNGDRLQLLLLVPSSAAGSISPGQKVSIRFDAFPYQRFGLGKGIVQSMASAASAPGTNAEPGYRVIVRLTDSGPAAGKLRADMVVTAGILVERRNLLDWLFAPLREKWREGRG